MNTGLARFNAPAKPGYRSPAGVVASGDAGKQRRSCFYTIVDHMGSIMFEFVQKPSRSADNRAIDQQARIAVIIKAVIRTADAWGLSNAEAAMLFGVSIATWSRMKAGIYKGVLDQDRITRASLLIGLYKGLELLFNGPLAYGWPKTTNTGSGFNGKTPVQIMCENGIPAMIKTRQHIDAFRVGV